MRSQEDEEERATRLRAVVTAMNSLSLLHTQTHAHAQHEVGSIPTDSESSWSNQIINLQGLNYIASVHTYCHIRDTATGTHTDSLCLWLSLLSHTCICTHKPQNTEAADIKQLNLNFGQVEKVLCMTLIKINPRPKESSKSTAF